MLYGLFGWEKTIVYIISGEVITIVADLKKDIRINPLGNDICQSGDEPLLYTSLQSLQYFQKLETSIFQTIRHRDHGPSVLLP